MGQGDVKSLTFEEMGRKKTSRAADEGLPYGAKAGALRRRGGSLAAARRVLGGAKKTPSRRKEGWILRREKGEKDNSLIDRMLQTSLRIAYLRPNHCLVANTPATEGVL